MTPDQKPAPTRSARGNIDETTRAAKLMIEQARAAREAKTRRLRELRLADQRAGRQMHGQS
ncbi:hypothetical protein [Shinella sp. G-2]|uniref:hypothetical protein n=1 Tax=Shinella sp. G-2 TaxID=3133141 RepID=UPI003D059E47